MRRVRHAAALARCRVINVCHGLMLIARVQCLPDYGPEVIGRRIALEITPRRWYVATVVGWLQDLSLHHLVYEDLAFEEEVADLHAR